MQAYKAGHVPGGARLALEGMLWDEHRREFPSPEDFARRLRRRRHRQRHTVVFYGTALQFGIYAWWTFRYCGHARVAVLDGGRYRWAGDGLRWSRTCPGRRSP